MNVRLLAVLLFLSSASYSQEQSELHLTGTAINTTNPDKPVAAPIQIIVAHGVCKFAVSLPLVGFGACTVKSYDKTSGHLEIVSYGMPMIVWIGTVKGNFASGTYKIDVGAQTGMFYLAIIKQAVETPPPTPTPPPTANIPSVAPHRGSCVPAIESSINGEIQGWDGETIFKLGNGQIWQQAEYDYTYFYEYSPEVTIYQTSAGFRMKVEDEDDTVLVKRIK